MLSAYEKRRLANIARNKAKLAALGLTDDHPLRAAPASSSSKRPRRSSGPKRKRASAAAVAPLRPSSTRARTQPVRLGQPNSAAVSASSSTASRSSAASPPAPMAVLPDHVAREFNNDGSKTGSSATAARDTWDPRRMHQHLQVSAARRAVATTGCAGYGAVLAARGSGTETSDGKGRQWRVRAVHLGVGGFGVGIAKVGWKGPFKSLGKQPASAVVGSFHAAGTFNSGRQEVAFGGTGYGAGDVVGVVLRPEKKAASKDGAKRRAALLEVAFSVNGVEVGVAAAGIEGKVSDYVLACQPYMGGVGRLL